MSGRAVALAIPVLLVLVAWYANNRNRDSVEEVERLCSKDLEFGEEVCRPACHHGFFSLPRMTKCVPWLTCEDFGDIVLSEMIGGGAVKAVYVGKWRGHQVAINRLAQPLYRDDFEHGLRMITAFQPHPYVTQLVGRCKDEFITEYHRHGAAEHLIDILETDEFQRHNTLAVRFGLCINYVELLVFLHNSSHGIRVMCDSNDLNKALNQLLVTEDLRLILNDLDALPEVIPPNGKIKCGHHEIVGDFAAPEQRWPYADRPFSDDDMPMYNERSDVWKIPDVCQHFLGSLPGSRTLVFHILGIHQKCKIEDPALRASVMEVLLEYKEVSKKLQLSD